MISKSSYPDDARVRREASTLVAAGYEVTVISSDEGSLQIDDVRVIGTGSVTGLSDARPTKATISYKVARWLLLPEHRSRAVSQFHDKVMEAAIGLEPSPDVVHAHDFPALRPAASLADRWSAQLVYDAHEYWSGLPRRGRPEPLRNWRNSLLERSLAREASRVITVSDGAAALLADDFGISDIAVVRNTFPLRHDLAVTDRPHGAVYAGRIGPGRDLETVFASSAWKPGCDLHLMGPVESNFVVDPTAHLHPGGTMDDVDRLLAEVGVGLVTLERGPRNHDIALPNKLFQALSVGIPVVAANLPEMVGFVRRWATGVLYEPGDPISLGRAIREVSSEYNHFVESVREAREAVNWEVDSRTLLSVYESL